MKTGLAALIHPYTIDQFINHYEQNKPLLIEPHEHTNVLRRLPFLASLQTLLLAWPLEIEAHLPDVRDESSAIATSALDAPKLYANGMGLLFNEAHTISPLLNLWLSEIRNDLGLSALTYGRCLIYATPDGKGTAPHFDQNINFVLQVQGTKIWKMAPNQHVKNPMTRHTMGAEPDPELISYIDAPFPTAMPEDALEFVLKPGSILFVPRGYWHSTTAEGDALALNFTFSAPTWIDLFTAALRSRLAQSDEWRETADGVASPLRRSGAEHKLDFLLSTLIDDLPHWKASDILEATES
jgi:50S ribosomal protein L16 3-hydroxylase